jgi:arabinosaccharide transport system substrate-binding protein
MPIFEEGGFTTTMGGGTGTVITDQIDESKIELAKEFLAFAKLTYEANVS